MIRRLRWNLIDLGFVLFSAIVLVCAFPEPDLSILAWIGMVPLLLAIDGKSLLKSFFLSAVGGIFFFAGIFHWILQVPNYTLLHYALIISYFGLYFGFFGLMYTFISSRCGINFGLFSVPFIWVTLEYARSSLSFMALPWGLFGHTQYQYPVVIQVAAITGTYGISFLVVLVNATIVSIVYPYYRALIPYRSPRKIVNQKRSWLLIMATSVLTIFTIIYGYIITSKPIDGRKIHIATIQGNIDQSKKWDPEFSKDIMQIYTEQTLEAAKKKPDLIVWPETATPGPVIQSTTLGTELEGLARKINIPILTGSAEGRKFESTGDQNFKYFNSGILFNPKSKNTKIQRYDKIRLFPFGEYLPYRKSIPWSLIGVPALGQFTPGSEFKVFELSNTRFATTICWENIFADLVRQFVKRNAEFIINITNEAHFGKTAAPFQLLAISIFRAVENRIFIVRCGNTGISCIIDPHGKVINRVKDDFGHEIFVRGIGDGYVIPLKSETIYTEYGDLIVWVAIFIALFCLCYAYFQAGKRNVIFQY